MRIHHLTLRDYRGVEHVEVDFSDRGVTIVEGDNEVGKTSLVEALDLLLAERDDATKRAVKAVKPVGRDAGAEVEAELSSGPYRFRYRKRWHKQKETVLDVLEPNRAQLTGREAHDRVRAILADTLDSSLWEALRLTQGAELAQSAFAGGSLGRALDVAAGGAGGAMAGEREDDLWARVVAERDRYWTGTGQPRAERQTAVRQLGEADGRVAELEATLAGLQADADEVDRLTVEARELADRQREQGERVSQLAKQVDAIQGQRDEVARLGVARDAARSHHDHMAERHRTRAAQVRRLADAVDDAHRLGVAVEAAAPARRQAEERLATARRAVGEAKEDVAGAEAMERRARADRDYRHDQLELDQMTERHARVTEATDRRAGALEVLRSVPVDGEVLARIEAAYVDLARAEAAATTASATVVAEAIATVELDVGGRSVALDTGQQHRLHVADQVELMVPGTVKVTVTAGAEAQGLADRLVAAKDEVAGLCADAGVVDLADARRAAAVRADAEREVARAGEAIAVDLRDLTVEDLAERVGNLARRVGTYEADRPAEPPLPPDYDTARALATELEQRFERERDRLARLERDLDAAAKAVQQADVDGAGSRARLEQLQAAVDHEQELLGKARAEAADEELDQQMAGAGAALAGAETALEAGAATLAAQDPDTVEGLLVTTRAAAARTTEELHRNDIRRRELRAQLSVRGEEGLASTLDDARSELARLTLATRQTEARAAAALLLHDTLAARRAEAHQRYVTPFRERIEQLGRVVFGPTLEVELDDELRIARRTLDGTTLDFADLSTGAKEQLGMLSRLACASIVADDGGAPVVFDDALGWSDPGRLERMGAAIDVAGRSCQVIVLTCTPGRYAGVGHATVVRLSG